MLMKKLGPESTNPMVSFVALLVVPVAVFVIHAFFNSGLFTNRNAEEIRVPTTLEAPPQVVFAARLGECTEKGAHMDGARGVFMPAMLTVWMRNFDGWMMDRAEGNEALLKGSGFTPATYRNYLSLLGRKGSVQTWAEESAFRTWVTSLPANSFQGQPDAATLAQMLLNSAANEKALPVKVDERMQQLHSNLLEVVKKNPALLDSFKITGNTPHSPETFTRFINERGMT